MPLFSIIIPLFNRASLIGFTLDSLIKQSFKDFEIIIVDDGSTDDVIYILSGFISSGIVKYYYQNNAGVSAARNKGVSMSNSNYLIFLDSDDSVSVNWLFDYAQYVEKMNPDIIYCGINRYIQNILVEYTNPSNPFLDGKSFGNVIPGSFCLKRILFDKIGGYDEKLAYGENTELSFRIKITNPTVAFIDKPNLFYNLHDDSHGKNSRNKMNGMIYIILKHPEIFNVNKNLKRIYLSIAGVSASNCGEYYYAKKLIFESLLLNPLYLKSYIRLCLVFIPKLRDLIWGSALRK
jgi:glycosyltransferase involved in cell wall biosynthesis